jgi:CheY-like chemotaxis protein
VGCDLTGTTVLVAEDNVDDREILEYVLGQKGGTVRSAKTAREALEVLLTWTPDVLLLDISMPDMDGFELLSTIRGVARLRQVPAVAVTAHAYERDKRRCLDAGFVEHLPKPYDADVLVDLVARLARRTRVTQKRLATAAECRSKPLRTGG